MHQIVCRLTSTTNLGLLSRDIRAPGHNDIDSDVQTYIYLTIYGAYVIYSLLAYSNSSVYR